MTKIYCRNYSCSENKRLESPVSVNIRRFYEPVVKEDNLYFGECQSKILSLVSTGISGTKVKYSVALCVSTKDKDVETFICSREDCIYNSSKRCQRDKIIVDRLVVENMIYWVCKNFSQNRISGHKDWSSNLDSGGHPKFGGHLDDDVAEKLDSENRKFKSFSGGYHRESNPRRKR